jgi:lysylphosphatidylglycerol synthetase-like protein (DUF2156 family)
MATQTDSRIVFWAPRLLTIAFLAFLSVFALDVFRPGLGFWRTLLAFLLHMMPVFVLAGVLALAWRWEWVGAVLFGAAGAAYMLFPPPPVRRMPLPSKLITFAMIAGPALLIGALFLVGWLRRRRGSPKKEMLPTVS